MIELDIYGAGLVTGASVMLMLAIGALTLQRRELWRVRRRLQGIVNMAKEIDDRWARRPLTGSDWNDMLVEIAPYEEV
jgi:hypothetical protein